MNPAPPMKATSAATISFQSKREAALLAMILVCGLAVIVALLTACDIAVFVLTARPASRLADPPRTSKLLMVGALTVAVGLTFGMALTRLLRRGSAQQNVVTPWSLGSVVLWAGLTLFLYGIYYPLPYHSHHIDKVLLGLSVVLIWGMALAASPRLVTVLTNGKHYAWIKILLINILAFIVIGEVVFRLIDPFLARGGLFGNKQTPAELKPHVPTMGSIRFTNSQGFRDRERHVSKAAGTVRIVALGDSFTYGAGVSYDDNFVTLLERGLQDVGQGAEVINLGVSGWDPAEEFHLLKMYGMTLAPDVVMMNVFVGNDIMRRRGAYLHWDRTRETLDEMSEFLTRRGVELVLVLLPAQEQLDPVLQDEFLQAVQVDRGRYDFLKPQRLLRRWAVDRGVFVIDLLPAFQQHPDPSALYFQNDIHWTTAAHHVAADDMLPLLRRYITERMRSHGSPVSE